MAQQAIKIPAEDEPLPPARAGRSRRKVLPAEEAHNVQPAEDKKAGEKGVMEAYRQWQRLREEIPNLAATAVKNLLWIESALNEYRLISMELTFRLDQVENEIWDLYQQVSAEYPRLRQRTARKPLLFSRLAGLKTLSKDWKAHIERQEKLLDLLSKAPEAQRVYNTTQLLRKHLAEEHARREETRRRIRAARELLENSLQQLSERSEVYEPITIGSRILRLEDAQRVWQTRLEEFRALENSDTDNPDELVRRIKILDETIREAPITARWIRATEMKFTRLVEANDLLVSLGKPAIPQEDLARMSTILYEVVPKHWLNGDNAELGRHLQALEKFIAFYEESIKRELDFAERRRPGITQALTMSLAHETFDLAQVTTLTRSLVHALDLRDRYMQGHSEEVTRLALQTARLLNWTTVDLEYLELAGLLHDVGKLAIPEQILTKIQPLTANERTLIEKHPSYGANLVKPVKGLDRIVPWIYHHQERWDGKGYPERLSKKDIPLGASIISVAEAYTVMTTNKPYRPVMTPEEALAIIREEAGRQFNPEVAEAFIDGVLATESPLQPVPQEQKG